MGVGRAPCGGGCEGKEAGAAACPRAAELEAQLEAWAADYDALSDAVAKAGVEAARKDAEIEWLEAELAAATARLQTPTSSRIAPRAAHGGSGPAGTERLRVQLSAATASLATALTHANVLLRKLGAADTNGLSVRSAGRHAAGPNTHTTVTARPGDGGRCAAAPALHPPGYAPLRVPGAGRSSAGGPEAPEAPDPALLPGLLSVAMERLARVVSMRLGLALTDSSSDDAVALGAVSRSSSPPLQRALPASIGGQPNLAAALRVVPPTSGNSSPRSSGGQPCSSLLPPWVPSNSNPRAWSSTPSACVERLLGSEVVATPPGHDGLRRYLRDPCSYADGRCRGRATCRAGRRAGSDTLAALQLEGLDDDERWGTQEWPPLQQQQQQQQDDWQQQEWQEQQEWRRRQQQQQQEQERRMREVYEQAVRERDALAQQLQQQRQLQLQQQRQQQQAAKQAHHRQPSPPARQPPPSGGARDGSAATLVGAAGSGSSGGARDGRAQRLVGQLRMGIAALHGACKGVEVACRGPRPKPGEVQQQVGALESGLQNLEATLGLLSAAVSSSSSSSNGSGGGGAAAAQQQQQQQQAQQQAEGGIVEGAEGEGSAHGSDDGTDFSFGLGPAQAGEGTHSSSTTTTTTTISSSSEPSLRGLAHPGPHGAPQTLAPHRDNPLAPTFEGNQGQQGALPQAGSDAEGASATSTLLAERLLAARARTEKWKARARHLGQQLALLGAGAATREAAVAERMAAAEGAAEEQVHRLRAEVQRLEAALVGAEGARRELESRAAQLSAAAGAAAAAGADGDVSWQGHAAGAGAAAAGPNTVAGAGAARAAELAARCAALEQQLEAERAQGAARCTALASEACGLRGALAQEQSERARLLGGMRGALTGLGSGCGDAEGRLRKELLDAHQAAAAAHAAQERTEAQTDAWRAEARVLRERLQTSEKARMSAVQALEARLLAAERHCARLADTYAARTEELAGRLALLATTTNASVPSGCDERLQRQQQQLVLLGEEMGALAARLAEHECGTRQQDVAGRWGWVAQAARYQRAIKGAMQELEGVEHKARLESAELKAHLVSAQERADAAAQRLQECQLHAAEAVQAADAERQRMSTLHLSHIAELQSRIEEERRAMADEAAVHAESMARSREDAAAAAGAAALAQAQAQHSQALQLSESRVAVLHRHLEDLGHAFKAYQDTRAAEVADLEQRVVQLISSSVAAADDPALDAPPHGGWGGSRSGHPTAGGAKRSKAAAAGGCRGGARAAACTLPCMHAVHNVAHSSNGRRYMRAGAAGHMPARSCGVCNRLLGKGVGRAGGGRGGRGSRTCGATRGADDPKDEVESDVQWERADQTRELLLRHQQTVAAAARAGGAEACGDWRGLQEVVAAVAEERVDAARREVLFERLHRQRAEASARAALKAMASARLRLRFLQREAQRAAARDAAERQREKDGWVGGEAHAAVVSELVSCREALRSVRAESARRQRALLTLQSLAHTGLLKAPQHCGATAAPGAALAAAGGKGGGDRAEGGVDPMVAHAAHAAAVAAAAAANAASGVAADVSANLDMYHGTSGDVQQAVHGYGGLRTLIDEAAARTATAALLERAAQRQNSDGSDDPFCIAAETATAAAAAAAAALEAEHAGREAAEAKLRDARGQVESKNARIKELKRRAEELEGELKEAQQADLRAAVATLEGRIKQANAAVARKDTLVRELKDRLEAAKQQAAAASQQQQQPAREAGEGGASDAERQARTIARLRGDLAKREASLKTALADLEKERQEAALAAHASWETGNQEAKALRQAAVALQQRACELMQAVRALLRLVLRCSKAAATQRQQQLGVPPHPSSVLVREPAAQAAAVPPDGGEGGLSEADIASLTSLSLSEVQDLLGPSHTLAWGADAAEQQPRQARVQPARQSAQQPQDGTDERCDELLTVMEATLLPHGVGVGADVSGGAAAHKERKQQLLQWDPQNLKLLLEAAEQRVQAVLCS